MAGEFKLTPSKGPYVGRTLSDVHVLRHDLDTEKLKTRQLAQTVRQIIDVAKLPQEEFKWYKLLGGRIMARTRKNRRGGQETSAEEVRRRQAEEIEAKRQAGIFRNQQQDALEARQRERGNIFSAAMATPPALPGAVGAPPSSSPVLRRMPADGVARRLFGDDDQTGGRRRKHSKSKKHILRRRGRHTRRRRA